MTKQEQSQFKYLIEMTKRLRSICSIYYIADDGKLYLKSLVSFTEVMGQVNNPEEISIFKDCIILPNQLLDFEKLIKEKKVKKADLIISEQEVDNEATITITIPDDGGILTLYKLCTQCDEDKQKKINERIIPELYVKYFSIMDNSKIDMSFIDYSEDEVLQLAKPDIVIKDIHGSSLHLTKQMFEDLKKTDLLSATKLTSNYNNFKNYFLIRHDTSYYTTYIMVAQKKEDCIE